MKSLPEKVSQAWESRKNAVVFSTVDANGVPNSIYVKSVSKYNDSHFVIADNYFDKTRKNILSGSKACILFITDEGKSYQLKGSVSYLQSGDIFNDMKRWNPTQHPGHAAVCLEIQEVYSGSEKIV